MTNDITSTFGVIADYTRMDNIIVRRDKGTSIDFANTNVDFSNYKDPSSTGSFDGVELPVFLRIWNTLDNILTFKAKKIMMFFSGIEPLFEDQTLKYDVGCSTSAIGNAYVRGYWFEGIEKRTNATGNKFSYLLRSR